MYESMQQINQTPFGKIDKFQNSESAAPIVTVDQSKLTNQAKSVYLNSISDATEERSLEKFSPDSPAAQSPLSTHK